MGPREVSLIVQKFGGTSVADTEKIIAAARKAVRAQGAGHQVVMVVSAMGKNTDMLEKLAREVNPSPPVREMDMLLSTGEQVSVALVAMAIDALGCQATSLTGGQIGIRTDSSHTKARIQSIETDRVGQLLEAGNIVIAAGFQGIDEDLNITTLGRGGSDTTAVALAAVLHADRCEIHTDVDGVYTTDPRLLPDHAQLIPQVSYDEMLELASLGAGVMHSRSIEFGKKFNIAIQVRNSANDSPGSLIVDHGLATEAPVSGAALTRDEARVTIHNVRDQPGAIFKIIEPLAEQRITIDMIVQNVSAEGHTDITFTLPKSEIEKATCVLEQVVKTLGGQLGGADANVTKVSIVGVGMASQTGVASRMFNSLAAAGVNIQMISTSEIKISALVEGSQSLLALKTVHNEFGLNLPNESSGVVKLPDRRSEVAAVDVVSRLHQIGMESLTIEAVELDDSQSRITLTRVPNQPGIAARIFDRVAQAQIFVDMIVQSYAHDDFADISFTVPRDQFSAAEGLARELQAELRCDSIETQSQIAKLSVAGVGLRSHTGVALETFRVLSDAGVNIEMINTSEVRLNVVVPSQDAQTGLARIRQHFGCVSTNS